MLGFQSLSHFVRSDVLIWGFQLQDLPICTVGMSLVDGLVITIQGSKSPPPPPIPPPPPPPRRILTINLGHGTVHVTILLHHRGR